MIEYVIQVRFSKRGKWSINDIRTFKSKKDVSNAMNDLIVEHKFAKAYLPDGYKNDYVEFRIVSRNVSEWKEV